MNLVLRCFYRHIEGSLGLGSGDLSYGNFLQDPIFQVIKTLRERGVQVFEGEQYLHLADAVVYFDLDEKLFQEARELKVPRYLVCLESPIYCPFPHRASVLGSRIWTRVFTYNTAYRSDNIRHCDIPVSNKVVESDPLKQIPRLPLGVVVASRKMDTRSHLEERDRLLVKLAKAGLIHVYGHGWNGGRNIFGPVSNKIELMKKYEYSLVIENSRYGGYVTEKLADAILAEHPSIYFGDSETAERRFPGTFVELDEISEGAFSGALGILKADYDRLLLNVTEAKRSSESWSLEFKNLLLNEFGDF